MLIPFHEKFDENIIYNMLECSNNVEGYFDNSIESIKVKKENGCIHEIKVYDMHGIYVIRVEDLERYKRDNVNFDGLETLEYYDIHYEQVNMYGPPHKGLVRTKCVLARDINQVLNRHLLLSIEEE